MVANEFRRVERLDGDNWTKINFADLKCGNRFRLFDVGCSVPVEDGTKVYTAVSELFVLADNNLMIHVG